MEPRTLVAPKSRDDGQGRVAWSPSRPPGQPRSAAAQLHVEPAHHRDAVSLATTGRAGWPGSSSRPSRANPLATRFHVEPGAPPRRRDISPPPHDGRPRPRRRDSFHVEPAHHRRAVELAPPRPGPDRRTVNRRRLFQVEPGTTASPCTSRRPRRLHWSARRRPSGRSVTASRASSVWKRPLLRHRGFTANADARVRATLLTRGRSSRSPRRNGGGGAGAIASHSRTRSLPPARRRGPVTDPVGTIGARSAWNHLWTFGSAGGACVATTPWLHQRGRRARRAFTPQSVATPARGSATCFT